MNTAHFLDIKPTSQTVSAIVVPRVDELLLRFREAAEIEHRLLTLESWLECDRPARDSLADHRRRTLGVLRLLTLLNRNRRLDPFRDVCHRYLLAVYERGAP